MLAAGRSNPVRAVSTGRAAVSVPLHTRRDASTRRARVVVHSSQQEPQTRANEELLAAFFYGRALATTVTKRLGAALVDGISAIGTRIATRESRMRSFQDEVLSLAKEEMLASAGFVSSALDGASSAAGSSEGSQTALVAPEQDIQANVDDLRATIASARALLQQMRQTGASLP